MNIGLIIETVQIKIKVLIKIIYNNNYIFEKKKYIYIWGLDRKSVV